MAKMRVRFLLLLCLLFGIFMLNINAVNAVSRTIYVDAEQEKVESISLKVDDEVSGRISVIGGSNNDINFNITDPDGEAVVPKERVIVKDFRFTASKEGTYRLHFDNSFSTDRKTVTFNYDVRHYIFGIPQEDFLVFVVMIVAVIGLVLFVALSRPQI
ncbi:MAG: emp24/gp25L/p24 family protein [Candidatus Bathyarchaeia archaeon]